MGDETMRGLFSLDSGFMQGLNRFADLVLLNVLFVVTSLPVITLGASLTAMYTVCFRFNEDWEEGVCKTYFRAFRRNFRQATVIWVVVALLLVLALGDVIISMAQPGWARYLMVVFGFIGLTAGMLGSMVFPLLSRFDNTVKKTLKNALLLAFGYAPHTLVLTVLNAAPAVGFLLYPEVFMQLAVLWFMFYYAAVAYLGSKLLKKPFAKLVPAPPADTEA